MKKKRGLVSCIQEFKKDTILTPIFVIGEVAFDVLIPMMTGRLLTQGVEAGNMERIFYYGGIVVLMALAALLLGALSGRYAARAATGFSRNLRREMYRNVQKFSFSNIDKFSTGGIITRLTTDVTNVQMAFMMIIRIAVRCPIMLICAWVLTFTINPRLALVFLVVIPILGLGLFFIMTGAHPIFERVFKRYDHLNNVVQENLLGIRVVKSFVREEHEKEKFGKVSQEIYMDFSKAEKLIAFNMPLMQLCVYACILTVSWLSAHLVVGGSMDVGQLTSMFSYIMMILMSLMMLSMVLVMIILARASAERITELLNEESDLCNGENPVEEVKDGSVVFENVSFSYAKDPSKECLKNVNLNIKSGETVGILGGTGTSKTTLVQLIPRLYDATEGRILVGGALALNGLGGGITLGVIASFLQLSKSLTNPISQISQQLNSVVMALAGAQRIFDLMDEPSEEDHGTVTLVNVSYNKDGALQETSERTNLWAWKVPQEDGSFAYTKLAGDVRFDDVDFAYEEGKTILHDISLFAKPGQKLAFVGATGAGKTTITNLINRFYDIADGKIHYDGISINDIHKPDLRRSLGIVLQDTNLFTGTVRENIRYGNLSATDEEVEAAAVLANADDFIRRLPQGYDTMLTGNGANLSQGQRQLIAIARAAVADPPVMILDEATSSIDTRTEAIVQRGMDSLMTGRTVFVIAHRLSTVRNSDAIMVLDHGRIVERGDHEDLIRQHGLYYQLYTGAFELE